jgi:intracellular multiplication protein IcmK
VQNISCAGNFSVVESEASDDKYTHVLKISPESEFAFGNMSIDMLALQTPIIITLESNRDIVHYRFDAVIPDYGPLAKAPIINTGSSMASAGNNKDMSSALEGVFPQGSVRMDVSGVDRRTSAYRYNGRTYVRTPLTLLSPAWSSSATSADGTKVYEIDNAPVLLLSDRGQMVQAQLSDREELLDE